MSENKLSCNWNGELEEQGQRASLTVTRVPAKKTFVRSTGLNTLQLFELQDNNKNRGILTENRCVDWSPAHFYGNHNGTGNQNKRKQCIKYRMTVLKRKM
jgi:hypothetical protein